MWRRSRIEITVETREVLTVRWAARPILVGCAGCGREVWMAPPESAAARASCGARRTYQLVEAGEVHFVESPRGALLVCLDSLAAAVG